LDAVFSDDLIFILLKLGRIQAAQIYINDEEFKLIDTIRTPNGLVLSIDMVFDVKNRIYDIYAVQRSNQNGGQLEIVHEKITQNQINAQKFTRIQFVSQHSLIDYPENCADKIRATQKYLVVDCQAKATETLILERTNLTPLVSVDKKKYQNTGATFEQTDIAVIEHNVDWASNYVKKVGGGKPTEWMDKYLKKVQTIIIASKKPAEAGQKPVVRIWEMFDSDEADRSSHVTSYDVSDVDTLFVKDKENYGH